MSFLPLPDITVKGTTPGSATGESVELLPHLTLPNTHTFTIEVRVVAAGYVFPSTKVVRSFVQRFSVKRESNITSVIASDAQDAFGDSAGSSWTMTGTAGSSPDRFRITFTTGSTRATTTITADMFITKAQ